jgi:hypothetical protein
MSAPHYRSYGWFPILPSLVTGVIALVIVSLMTPPPSQAVLDRFFGPGSDGR